MIAMRFERIHLLVMSAAAAFFLIVALSKYGVVPSVDTVTQSYSSRLRSGKPLNLEQRMQRSAKSYQKMVRDRRQAREHFTPDDHLEYSLDTNMYVTIWDFFYPAYTCPWDLERVGHLGEGGKFVCGFSKYMEHEERELVVYSFGVNVDSSFEEGFLADTNAKVWAFDFSVDSFGQELAEEHKNRSTFMKVGLSDRNTPTDNPPFYTLKTLMEKNGHDYIDYLKVDIEGAEYDSMGKFMDDFAEVDLPVGQFALEVHLRLDPDGPDFGFAKVSNFMERFESFGLRAVANEVNYGSADSPPRYIEYVWVNINDPKNVLWHE